MKQEFTSGPGDRDVDTLMADYLSALIRHLTSTLPQTLSATPFEFVITVPAIWSDPARERTRQACRSASGSSAVQLISETEAAAIYAVHALHPQVPNLSVGDEIVVLDAGGATVDLVSYTIRGLEPVLEVEEAGPGTGALCGSKFLDMRFAGYLRRKLGGEEGFGEGILARAVEHFEKKVCPSKS